MKYLVLIGNGFDLAHGMKTGYGDFLRWLVESEIKKGEISNLINSKTNINLSFQKIIEISKGQFNQAGLYYSCNNSFLKELLRNYANKNWCDIEQEYFDLLLKTSNPEIINADFNIIKIKLEEYLLLEQERNKDKEIVSLKQFFGKLKNKDYLILNFNYTNTLERYANSEKTLHLHGKLLNEKNPVIFGYSPDNNDLTILHEKNNSKFIEFIKPFLYDDNENRINELYDFLNDTRLTSKEIFVFSMGLSFGKSDLGLFEEILDNYKVKSVYPLFYNLENLRNIKFNISKALKEKEGIKKIKGLKNTHRMPQFTDGLEKIDAFNDFLTNNLNQGPSFKIAKCENI